MRKDIGFTMSKFLSVVEFSNSYCFILVVDGKQYPFTFREFTKEKAHAKGLLLGKGLGITVHDNDGQIIGDFNGTSTERAC